MVVSIPLRGNRLSAPPKIDDVSLLGLGERRLKRLPSRHVFVEYDVESEVKELLASGHPHADWLAAMRRTARYVPPL
jgi:hypothetical protein